MSFKMKHDLVQKCDCCDNQLSQISIPHLSEKHKKNLSVALIDTLQNLKAKGSCSLLCIDEMIVAINYGYAGKKEVKRAQIFYESLYKVADDYFQSIINECDVEYYELAA